MNTVMEVPVPGGVNVGEVLSFFGIPARQSAKQLSGSAEELLRNMSSLLDEFVSAAIEKHTSVEFRSARKEVFPQYFMAMRAFADVASIVVPPQVRERLTWESFSELESDFRDHALSAFGADIRDQGIFTIWTLRKIGDLVQKIKAAKLPDHLKEKDEELATQFAFYAVWTRFHVDCLIKSMRLQMPIYPEVVGVVLDGLRSAVNSYAWASSRLELRVPRMEPGVEPIEWDEEEQALLDEATHDMLAEPS